MQMKLIFPKKSKGETDFKTEIGVPKKEWDNTIIIVMLALLGRKINEPDRETSRNKYFVVHGDLLNTENKMKGKN